MNETIKSLLIKERKELAVLRETYKQYIDFVTARITNIDTLLLATGVDGEEDE